MFEVITDTCRLRELMSNLNGEKNVHKMSLVGALRSSLVDLFPFEAVVDNWPNWKHIVVRRSEQKLAAVGKGFLHIHVRVYTYSRDPSTFGDFIYKALDWTQTFQFAGTALALLKPIADAALKHGGKTKPERENYWMNVGTEHIDSQHLLSLMSKLPPGFTLGSMRPEHSKVMLSQWKYMKASTEEKYENTIKLYKYLISRNLTSCVFNPAGEPVSWAMIKVDSSGGMAHTLDEYRNMGLYSVVHADITKKIQQANMISFGYTRPDNENALHVMLDKVGGESMAQTALWNYTPPVAKL